ncbi:unnamed protein product [Adineta steineri]|uniref:TIR domain-containing protein n=2 Tax=Adineta steineri TaxID=433720 RepID=A0A819IR71_9BILA|nr:unnamed protein product [Adineta steineri]
MYDGLRMSLERIKNYEDEKRTVIDHNCAKLIICITDGLDNQSQISLQSIKSDAIKQGIVIDIISYVPESRYRIMSNEYIAQIQAEKQLCLDTRGYYYKDLASLGSTLQITFEREAALSVAMRSSDRGEQSEPKCYVPDELQNEIAICVKRSNQDFIAKSTNTRIPVMRSPTNNKHVMLSYQWDSQSLIEKVYNLLTLYNIRVWMDVHGGVRSNIYQSMAEGVEGAAIICCFLTRKYQDSINVQRELQFAQTQGKIIVPVRLESGWTESGWLGLITAGLTWINFRNVNDSNLESKVEILIRQLLLVYPALTTTCLLSPQQVYQLEHFDLRPPMITSRN